MNVLIIDDHSMMADGIIKRVKKVLPEAECTFVDNVRSAYAELHHRDFDLIISDLELDDAQPELPESEQGEEVEPNGFSLAKYILTQKPDTKIIALTHYNSYRIMKKAKASGFKAFLNKGSSFNDFSETLLNVLKNGEYVSETEKQLVKKRKAVTNTIFNDSLKGIVLLSKRELELTLLCSLTTDRNELAQKLKVEPYTIDSHFKHIMSKLNLGSRKEVALFAMDYQKELSDELKARHK